MGFERFAGMSVMHRLGRIRHAGFPANRERSMTEIRDAPCLGRAQTAPQASHCGRRTRSPRRPRASIFRYRFATWRSTVDRQAEGYRDLAFIVSPRASRRRTSTSRGESQPVARRRPFAGRQSPARDAPSGGRSPTKLTVASMTTSGCSKSRVAVSPSRIPARRAASVAASSSGTPGTTVASRRCRTRAGHRTRRASAVTSTPLAAWRGPGHRRRGGAPEPVGHLPDLPDHPPSPSHAWRRLPRRCPSPARSGWAAPGRCAAHRAPAAGPAAEQDEMRDSIRVAGASDRRGHRAEKPSNATRSGRRLRRPRRGSRSITLGSDVGDVALRWPEPRASYCTTRTSRAGSRRRDATTPRSGAPHEIAERRAGHEHERWRIASRVARDRPGDRDIVRGSESTRRGGPFVQGICTLTAISRGGRPPFRCDDGVSRSQPRTTSSPSRARRGRPMLAAGRATGRPGRAAVSVRKDRRVTRGSPCPGDDPVALAPTVDRLTGRLGPAPDRPAGVLGDDVRRHPAFQFAVVPFAQVRIFAGVREAGERAVSTRETAGWSALDRRA
jgi:hypothetical protein